MSAGQFYKVKLSSGRILGPLDITRVRLLIVKNQIIGTETAREYPQGDWKDVNLIPEIAELLMAKVAGKLDRLELEGAGGYQPILGNPLSGATQMLSTQSGAGTGPLPELQTASAVQEPEKAPEPPASSEPPPPAEEDEGKTMVVTLDRGEAEAGAGDDEEKTRVVGGPRAKGKPVAVSDFDLEVLAGISETPLEGGTRSRSMATDQDALDMMSTPGDPNDPPPEPEFEPVSVQADANSRKIAEEHTVMFQRSTAGANLPGKQKKNIKDQVKSAVVVLAVVLAGYELFLGDEPPKKAPTKFVPIRPKLPAFVQDKTDPEKSQKIYAEAMRFYIADTVTGYKQAAEKLLVAAGYDMNNTKALAMLASCYLNLIDSSNKDADYFSVITKLIDMSRAKDPNLPETVIADVELYVTVNRAEAAQSRVVDYAHNHPNYGLEMYYYLGLAFMARGDMQSAARYIQGIPDNKVFSAKIFYLRGLIAEKLNDQDAAIKEYLSAIKFNKNHARSYLKIADILSSKGRLKEAEGSLEFIVNHPELLGPKNLARAYYLHAQLNELGQKWDLALGDVERAVKLDKDDHDYLLELYTLRAKVGDSVEKVQKAARMYFFLGEGEKLLKAGRSAEALAQFLQARQANPDSYIPPMKIGDMFSRMNNIVDAKMNYKLAYDKAPTNIDIGSKYINILIQSFEWDEAKATMDKYRALPVSQSAVDKAAGDMYARQGSHVEAQMYYRKAMERDSIDPDVYIAFAKSLMAVKDFKNATFFFALALRFDPLNSDAIISIAKCVAATDSVDRGVSLLQDELQKNSGAKAEYLSAIAEFQIQKGEWGQAQQYVDQAMAANPDYAYPWKLQAQIWMNKEGLDKTALDKALDAYKSYSDRNAGDPSGYLERYRVFTKKAEFDKASEELNRIFGLYPKYPNLHYYRGQLYGVQGNHKAAADEYQLELKNNPTGVNTMVALGKELVEIGGLDKALELFNTAMQMAPQAPEPKHQSGYVNYLKKNYQGAVALYNAALVHDKGNSLIYKRMGMAYRDMGDGVGARNAFKKYLEMEPDAPDRAEFERYL